MKVYEIKFESYNRLDYVDFVTAKNEKEAFKIAKKHAKKDDRDKIVLVKLDPSKGLGGYPWYK